MIFFFIFIFTNGKFLKYFIFQKIFWRDSDKSANIIVFVLILKKNYIVEKYKYLRTNYLITGFVPKVTENLKNLLLSFYSKFSEVDVKKREISTRWLQTIGHERFINFKL